VGDFNGDGNQDIILQHADGNIAVWFLTGGSNLLMASLTDPSSPGSADWRLVGVTDLNGDGKPDLLFQNSVDGKVAVWFMNGSRLVTSSLLSPSQPGGTWRMMAPR